MATKSRKTKAVEVDTASPEAEAAPVDQITASSAKAASRMATSAHSGTKRASAPDPRRHASPSDATEGRLCRCRYQDGLHPATVGIQRARALRKQGET